MTTPSRPDRPSRLNRRTAALAAVAALAAAAGAGVAWRRGATQADDAASSSDAGALAALWALRLDRPEGGGQLALAGLRSRPLVVNFWATWCVPCVEEMPLLDRFRRDAAGAGWEVAGLALDGAEPVRRFLRAHPVSFPVGLLGGNGLGLVRALGNAAGGLPFSVFIDASGRIAERRLGKLDESRLAGWKRRAAGG